MKRGAERSAPFDMEDNTMLMEHDPGYLKMLDNLPEDLPEDKAGIYIRIELDAAAAAALKKGVKIVNGKRKGKFELEFYGQEDLQNLLDALMKLEK